MAKKEPQLSVAEARKLVRATGLRGTTCRIAVLQLLAEKTSPVTHAELADLLVPEGFDKSTVYRCLIEMADAGLLGRFDLGDHVWRFELKRAEHSDSVEHPHFMCLDCGKVTCLPDVDVQIGKGAQGKNNGVGNVTEVLLKGHCNECT